LELSENAKRILQAGKANIRVRRSGMYQVMPFVVKRIRAGQEEFVELFLDRIVDMPELIRVANETGLPVEAQNGRAFPDGKSAKDFIGF
jgi:hypothetical protein